MNMYYKCHASKAPDNPCGCSGLIRADRWTQLAQGKKGQRWYCHCGARYVTSFGVCIEMIGAVSAKLGSQ